MLISLISGCTSSRPVYCPELQAPPPLAKNIRIVITADQVSTNKGGEALLRDYAAMRAMILSLCRD